MKQIKSILSIIFATAFMITSGINISALELSEVESGIYEVQNDVYYENEIGMSMARTYLDPTMKLKIKDGKVHYTIKFSGVNYMENHTISVNGKAVSVSKNKQSDTIELGFETNTINPKIKASMYVGPMGRDVEFEIITKTDTLKLIEKIEEPKEEIVTQTVKDETVTQTTKEDVKDKATKEEAKEEIVEEVVKEEFKIDEVFKIEIGPTIGSHAGPGTIGICLY